MPIHPVVHQWIVESLSTSIVTFGSDRFHSRNSDVDVAVFLPQGCTRDAFFEVFRRRDCVFSDVVLVQQAFVPVVKFRYHKETYDVIPICTNKPLGYTSYTFADLIDETDCRGFSAVVTTDVILSIIGPLRLAIFQSALETIKNLARHERVYSNPLGLLNGVALAVMLTHVFCVAPKERVLTPEGTVTEFFRTFSTCDSVHVDLLSSTAAEPIRPFHRGRPMQVLIPVAHPTLPFRINTLHNVGPAQFRRIQNFLRRTSESLPINPFLQSNFFIHLHIFSGHEHFQRVRTQFESMIKRLIMAIEEPEWARVDVFSQTMPVFRSVRNTRTSFFLGVEYDEEKLDLLLGVVSTFCVKAMSEIQDASLCSDVFRRDALPSFVEF